MLCFGAYDWRVWPIARASAGDGGKQVHLEASAVRKRGGRGTDCVLLDRYGEHMWVIDNVRIRPEPTGALWFGISRLPLSAFSAP